MYSAAASYLHSTLLGASRKCASPLPSHPPTPKAILSIPYFTPILLSGPFVLPQSTLILRLQDSYSICLHPLTINYEWFCDFGWVTFKWATKQFLYCNVYIFVVWLQQVVEIHKHILFFISSFFFLFFLISISPLFWECSSQNENAKFSFK